MQRLVETEISVFHLPDVWFSSYELKPEFLGDVDIAGLEITFWLPLEYECLSN